MDGANLEKSGKQWAIKDILNGGVSTWPEIADHVNRVSLTQMVTIRRVEVVRTNASCEFPKAGSEFVAVSLSGDKSNWIFKDGASEGIPFKEQHGPFENTDLKSVPSRTVYMNSYGP